MRIYINDLSKTRQNEIKDMLKEVGLDSNQVDLYKDGKRTIAENKRTGGRYTLIFDK